MCLQRFCYCVSLRNGCRFIGIFFIYFFFIEMTFHGQHSIFVYAKTNLWDVWQGVVLSSGIVSSLLLFYGAHKGKRFPVATSFYVYVFIFVSYLVMAIQDMVASKKVSMKIIAAEIIVLAILLYSILVIYSYSEEIAHFRTFVEE